MLLFFSLNNSSQKEMNKLKSVELNQWKNTYDNNKDYVVIDVRTQQEFNEGHIENAINIDFYSDNFEDQLNNLDKNENYLIYCRSGARSSKSLALMKDLEFNHVLDLSGGIVGWNSAGYKTVQ
jgi:rhodanese-related sulfurtransferase